MMQPLRLAYEKHGSKAFYEAHGHAYRNPHEERVRSAFTTALQLWNPDLTNVLDLACGSGEITLALRDTGCVMVEGIDPYTGEAYRLRTGAEAEALSFEDIAAGALARRSYSLIVCSYALHLVTPSRLPDLSHQLALIGSQLLILSPHKRPQMKETWGWRACGERVVDRVRIGWYASRLKNFAEDDISRPCRKLSP